VRSDVLTAVEPLQRLGQWWLTQGKPESPEDWITDGQLFLSQSPGLRRALWVDMEGRQRWSAAPGTTPDIRTIRPDEVMLRQIARIKSGEPIAVSEVFGGSEGQTVYVCFPAIQRGRTRGYVLGLYDVRALVQAVAHGAALQEQRIAVSVDGRQIYESGGEAEGAEESASADIVLANQVWNLRLSVPLHYFREFKGLIVSVVVVVGAIIYAFAVLFALSQRWGSALHRLNSALENEVDQRTRAEAQIRELNRELSRKVADFETLVDVIPIGIAVADGPEGGDIRVNRVMAGMLGKPEAAKISDHTIGGAGLPCRVTRDGRELLPDERPMRVAAMTAKSIFGEESRIKREDGTAIDVLTYAAPLFDENRQVRGALGAFVDISERKRLEQRLNRAERMRSLGGMAAGIAHDFNNLLTSILGHGSFAAEYLPEDSEGWQHIRTTLESAHKASLLIQKVLAYTGQSFHKLRPTNLADTIMHAQPRLCSLAAPRATIRFDIAPQLPEILADVDEVRRVIENVVINAAEATVPEGGSIQIQVGRCELSGNDPHLSLPDEDLKPGTYVHVEVTDCGIGMSPETAERAFDPFFSTKFLGRGLGLSEVLGIMRAHHGAVRLATAPVKGTSVQLLFPARELSQEKAGVNQLVQ
jgi:signal transduction histidine kinase